MIDAIKNGIIVSIRTSSIINTGVTMEALLYSFTSFNNVFSMDILLSCFQK